ncbi:serine/arginine-rich splicing factor 10 [Hydra vulgaris]|uniref:serine/arginine-rich splicing factor 10 n=1 Tax=Hydra vulgaris TaxID=6087 RepID=UPI001F5E4BA0|nr:serine/arginine-rich splicing factor 10-like [Hydra vulgaris]
MSGNRYARPPNTSLYIRNLSSSTRSDDLRRMFAKYGPIRDIYIPLDYYTREPRGFCYVQFEDIRDAEDALYHESHARLHGRELDIQYAEGDRKTPGQMRTRESTGSYSDNGRFGGRRGGRYSRSRSRSRSPRRRRRYSSRSRSRSPRRRRSVSRSPVKRSPSHSPRKSYSPGRSASPRKSRSASRSRSRSRSRGSSTKENGD